MAIRGKAWTFGDHVNTDDIIAARYLDTTDETELASHCMETLRPGFPAAVAPGDIIVAGDNFGCGSSREHAPVAIKALGVPVVIARSFARIFLRNAVNIGLPIVELPEAGEISEGDELAVDLEAGTVTDLTLARTWRFPPYPAFLRDIVASGGLMTWIARKHTPSA